MSDKPSIDWNVWGVSAPQDDAEVTNADAGENALPDAVEEPQVSAGMVFDTEESEPAPNNDPSYAPAYSDAMEVEAVPNSDATDVSPTPEVGTVEDSDETFTVDSPASTEWQQFPGFDDAETLASELTDEELIDAAGFDGFQLPAYDEETPVDMVEQEEEPAKEGSALTILPLPSESKEESEGVEFHQHSHLAEDERDERPNVFARWVMPTTIVALAFSVLALVTSICYAIGDNTGGDEKPVVTKTVTVTPTATKTVTVDPNKP